MNAVDDVAGRLAVALDTSDYDTARELLASDCVYHIGSMRIEGPEAVTASYRENDEWAKANFDHIGYESTAQRVDDKTVLIEYVDRITHGSRSHVHRCEQLITVDENELVVRIEHRDLPQEQETLEDFLETVGIKRGG